MRINKESSSDLTIQQRDNNKTIETISNQFRPKLTDEYKQNLIQQNTKSNLLGVNWFIPWKTKKHDTNFIIKITWKLEETCDSTLHETEQGNLRDYLINFGQIKSDTTKMNKFCTIFSEDDIRIFVRNDWARGQSVWPFFRKKSIYESLTLFAGHCSGSSDMTAME